MQICSVKKDLRDFIQKNDALFNILAKKTIIKISLPDNKSE